jgi:hypothetical protein
LSGNDDYVQNKHFGDLQGFSKTVLSEHVQMEGHGLFPYFKTNFFVLLLDGMLTGGGMPKRYKQVYPYHQ